MVKLINGLSKIRQAWITLKPTQQQQLKAIANKIYRNRLRTGKPGDEHKDWEKAIKIYDSPARRLLFHINQPLIKAEKGVMEPVANWLDKADLFRIIERISPAIEALGVLAIPLVLFFATQGYQERLEQQASERQQQQAVKDYLSQLSTLLLDVKGGLRDPQNKQLRTLTEATTLAFLDEPNLDGRRKGQVINFLSQMKLVSREIAYGPLRPDDKEPTLSLHNANLSGADLLGADLSGADLLGADLTRADLSGADLSGADLDDAYLTRADLSGADLSGANLNRAYLGDDYIRIIYLHGVYQQGVYLSGTNLNGANLSGASLNRADLSGADLSGADLSNADLRAVDLSGADLNGANLSDADLSRADLRAVDLSGAQNIKEEQLESARLCQTKLSQSIDLDPNRGCP